MARVDKKNKAFWAITTKRLNFRSGRTVFKPNKKVIVEFNRNDKRLIYVWDEAEQDLVFTFQDKKTADRYLEYKEQYHGKAHSISSSSVRKVKGKDQRSKRGVW